MRDYPFFGGVFFPSSLLPYFYDDTWLIFEILCPTTKVDLIGNENLQKKSILYPEDYISRYDILNYKEALLHKR